MECQEQGQIDPVFDARLFFTGMGEGLQPLSELGCQRMNTQSGTRQLGEGQVYLTFFSGAVQSDAVPRHGPGLPRGLGQLLQHAERAGFSLLRPERYGGALYIRSLENAGLSPAPDLSSEGRRSPLANA